MLPSHRNGLASPRLQSRRSSRKVRFFECLASALVCVQAIASVEVGGDVSAWSLKSDQLPSQSIFKMHYADTSGGVNFRLVMRVASPEHFMVSTTDTFGRRLWNFEFANGRVTMVDHRTLEYCASDSGNIPGFLALELLSLESLPLILFGRLPARPSLEFELSPLGQKFRDHSGRKWSVRGAGDDPDAWTLWGSERPEIWWTRNGEIGILSRRNGTQIRWKMTSLEALSTRIRSIEIPETYAWRACDDADLSQFREDQPTSSGLGTQR